MAYNTKQIIHGAAAVFFSAKSSRESGFEAVKLPAYVADTSFASALEGSADWHHVGLTTEGVEVEYSPEFKDVEVDQLLDAAEVYKTKQTMTVKTTMIEATLEHLLFVWGFGNAQLVKGGTAPWGDGSTATTTVPAGDQEFGIYEGQLGESPVERKLAFVGPGNRGLALDTGKRVERVYFLRRVLQVEASSHGLKRADETVFPVSFRCLPDPSSSFVGAGYGVIRERTYT